MWVRPKTMRYRANKCVRLEKKFIMQPFPLLTWPPTPTTMERGRRSKTYFPRINPILHFSDHKFKERYRLSKEIVQDFANRYANSDFCTTQLDTRGGGLSADERVSIDKIFLTINAIIYLKKY